MTKTKVKSNGFWIGSPMGRQTPIASNKPHNFFKTDQRDYPSYMFQDSDGDGVPNVFDCQPNNPNKQGFIDAVIGAVKGTFTKGGSAKEGWKQGMERTGNPISRRYRQERQHQIERRIEKRANLPQKQKDRLEQKEIVTRLKGGTLMERGEQAVGNYITRKANALYLATKRANPKYDMEYRGKKISEMKKRLEQPISNKQRMKLNNQIRKAEMIQEARQIQLNKTARGQLNKSVIKTMTSAFPMVMPMSGSHVMGAPGQKGRPRGSLDPRYIQYGGVYGYRKAMSIQKKMQRAQEQQMEMQAKMQRQPQYETQQYQIPQEMQGQGVVPEYSQFPSQQETQVPMETTQMPQQQYPQQQYASQPQKRPIATVFKSSGGSPYPPVPQQGLAPTNQTIPQGYVESVDSFTGRRFLKKLPPPERWAYSRSTYNANIS